MLHIKRKKYKKKKNGRDEFNELNIEAVSESWFEKLLKLVREICTNFSKNLPFVWTPL